jgi:hypothetical protein
VLIVGEHVLIPLEGEDEEAEVAAAADGATPSVSQAVEAPGGPMGAPMPARSTASQVAVSAAADSAGAPLRSSSWLDVTLVVPVLSLAGGALIGSVWLGWLVLFALARGVEGVAGIALSIIVAVTLLPVALAIMWWIGHLFQREEYVRATNIRASHMRGYAAVLTVIWGLSLAALLSGRDWLGAAGFVGAVGAPLPLFGFVRTIKRFRPFLTVGDVIVATSTYIVALLWLIASSGGTVWVIGGFVSGFDVNQRVVFGGLLPLIAALSILVLAQWVIPWRDEAAARNGNVAPD